MDDKDDLPIPICVVAFKEYVRHTPSSCKVVVCIYFSFLLDIDTRNFVTKGEKWIQITEFSNLGIFVHL